MQPKVQVRIDKEYEVQKEIADSFPERFAEVEIYITITEEDFAIYSNGIFSHGMDEKWNIFVIDNIMYWSRSWTGFCFYKVALKRDNGLVTLSKVLVNRNPEQYNSDDLDSDKDLFVELFHIFRQGSKANP